MVEPDLSFEHSRIPGSPIAPVFDRVLAFLIDFLVFSPVVSLFAAALLRDFRVMLLLDPESSESLFVWTALVSGSILLCVLLEALSLYFLSATPGQRFLKIQILSWPVRGRLTFFQCLGRPLLWWLSLPLGLPLLGAFTNPLRRAFHDRATDTMVTTLKRDVDPGPLDLEMRFFRSWSQMAFLFAVMVGLGVVIQVRRSVQDGHFTQVSAVDSGALCADVDRDLTAAARMDRAVAGFLAGRWDAACLEIEADHALWTGSKAVSAFAHLAKGLALQSAENRNWNVLKAGDEISESAGVYLTRACELEANGEACGLVKFLTAEKDRAALLRRTGLSTVTSRMLLLNETVKNGEVASAAALVRDLRGESLLSSWLDRQEVRTFWKARHRGRSPASDENRRLLEDFEERYELR